MSAKSRYEKLTSNRSQFLQRARHNALLTIPSLVPLEGQSNTSHLIEPYQGLGGRGVAHLSSRMLVSFLPAGRPYMRFDLDPAVKLMNGGEVDTATAKGLTIAEQLVQGEAEGKGWRASTLMSLLQLMVAGSVVEYLLPDNRIRLFRLDQFVVRRNYDGSVLELVIKECFDRDALPEGIEAPKMTMASPEKAKDEQIELYTHIKLVSEKTRKFYRRTQELGNGTSVGSPTSWAVDEFPYFCLRWSASPGEDYGRSKVEDHIADLRSLDALEKANLEMAAMASRNFIALRPSAAAAGVKNRLVSAINGDVVVVDPDNVELKSFDNARGYQITANQVQILRDSLSRAFLLMSGAQRNAERVTATEIERDLQELEASLGGTFSTLSQEMMEARTRILILQMQAEQRLPAFPKGTVVPVILTGLEALSRERDVNRAMQAAELVRSFLATDESAGTYVKMPKILHRAFLGLGFPDAVRDEAEAEAMIQQQQEAAMQSEMMTKSAPGVAREVVKQGGEK
ncbi:MAG: hypothetical protein GEU78_07920 [Actinobacteria bacterium]|nr:hypothetical protein [Actinomycetota bacterium]